MKKFTRAFWVANWVELLERLAYYAVFISLTIYLSNIWSFSDVEAGVIAGIFSALLYLLPTFMGAYADKIGFRNALMTAFGLLTIGYLGLAIGPTLLEAAGLASYGASNAAGLNPDLSETNPGGLLASCRRFFSTIGIGNFTQDTVFTGLESGFQRWTIAPILLFLVVGGSFIKSVITGTVAKETSKENRARGFAVFYMMVNIGAFTGKTYVDPLRRSIGDEGLIYLNYFSAIATLIGFLVVVFLYKSTKVEKDETKTLKEIWEALIRVCKNGRLIALILITSGFWTVQSQMYASMPKYVLRMVGEGASPGWIANVNPLVVFICVNLVTSLMQKRTALQSITVGMFIIPISALVMSSGNLMGSELIFGFHPVTLMMIIGIAFQAIAECFISPRFLEYFSLQAPKGEEGLYLGFSHLHSFISYLVAFIISGFLLEAFCPDPRLIPEGVSHAEAYAHAHYLWLVFFFIGLIAAIALIIYSRVIKKIDAEKGLVSNN